MQNKLMDLQEAGCWPVVAWHGKRWRVHVNGAGNYWADGRTPEEALSAAVRLWEDAGRPMDGYADTK
jgi:hypothetical protein